MSHEFDEFREVEAILRRVPLRRPSEMLDERVRRVIRPRWGLALGVAAVLTLLAGTGAVLVRETWREAPDHRELSAQHIGRVEVGRIAQPIVLAQTVEGTANETVIANDGEGTFRRVTRVVIRQVKYLDPETGRTIYLTVPREEVVLIKAEAF
jgi:hypothetical protein